MRVLAATLLVAAAPALTGAQAQVAAAMAASAAAWNAGDLNRFTAAYAEDATFITRDAVLRGRSEIAARYAPLFAKGSARGQLTVQPVAFRTLGPAQQLLVARWTLGGAAQDVGMRTTIWERRPQGWRIVADHAS